MPFKLLRGQVLPFPLYSLRLSFIIATTPGVTRPYPDELRTLLATILAGAAGGTIPGWRKKIGPVVKLPLHSNVRCNWMVDPDAEGEELAVILQAASLVRGAHPYAS